MEKHCCYCGKLVAKEWPVFHCRRGVVFFCSAECQYALSDQELAEENAKRGTEEWEPLCYPEDEA